MALRIDHIGHAVPDLEAAVATYRRLYGLEVAHRLESEADGVREAMLSIGDAYIQLLEPTRSTSPVARFLDRRGPGLHHVALAVTDVGATLRHVEQQDARLVDTEARLGSAGGLIAFVHPQSTVGALVELVGQPGHSEG